MNVFSFIKERVSIIDVVSEYVTLKRAGGYYKGTCPFHHEKTASFTVSPDKGIFYCFGCHFSGDVISFIAKVENCSQKEGAQLLAERYHVTIPHEIATDFKKTEDKKHYFAICKAVALWCHEQLMKNQSALSYFQKRGFNHHNIEYFQVGYFPGGSANINNLLYHMKKESILAQDLIDAQILAQNKATLYSPFEERIIFPIQDALGRHCGFGGRIFKEHDTRAKYYNSRENDYFVKGSLLFNLDRAKKSIQEKGSLFLVEGYTDCMAMIQHGFLNTVATLGTSCTIEHLKQIARYTDQLLVMYDNDNAGQQAILRLTQLCWQVNLELKVILLPPGEDPASFLYNKNNLSKLISTAQDIFLFFVDSLGNNFISKPLNQKLHIAQSFLSIITHITEPLKQDILLQRASKIFDIPFESLKKELDQISTPVQTPSVHNNSSPEDVQAPSILEKRIFCAIMNNIQLLQGADRWHLIKYVSSPLREIIMQLKEAQDHDNSLTFSHFFDMLDEHQKHYVGSLLLKDYEHIDMYEFDTLLTQLQKKQWKVIVHTIKTQLARAKQENDFEKVSLILHDFMLLKNTLMPSNHTTLDSTSIKKLGGNL